MSRELLPLPEGECSEWLQHGKRVNAFPYPKKRMAEQSENERNYWVPKGYDAAPLFTADQMLEYALANLQAAKPADALGSLPVVAYQSVQKNGLSCGPVRREKEDFADLPKCVHDPEIDTLQLLTYHAQATSELAKREEIIERYSMCIRENQAEIERLRAKMEAAKDASDRLASAAWALLDASGHASESSYIGFSEMVNPWDEMRDALTHYQAAKKEPAL